MLPCARRRGVQRRFWIRSGVIDWQVRVLPPSVACLTELQGRAIQPTPADSEHPAGDETLKCALRSVDTRLGMGCAVVDSEVAALDDVGREAQLGRGCAAPAVAGRASEDAEVFLGSVLRRCVDELLTYHALASRFAALRQERNLRVRRDALEARGDLLDGAEGRARPRDPR